jgi:dTDP-4-dehydrorhamnose 3,5-epimerase
MSDRFTIVPTRLAGLHVLERHPHRDSRGYLERLFCEQDLQAVFGGDRRVVQINRTLTRLSGTVRGLHFQRPPHAETKVVTCLRGEVFDVAVDLRPASPTFLEWHGEVLSQTNGRSLLIPEGFAHGFQTTAADCELLYFHSAAWCAAAEGGLHPLDPRIAVAWPHSVSEMSDRDRHHPLLDGGCEDVLFSKVAA